MKKAVSLFLLVAVCSMMVAFKPVATNTEVVKTANNPVNLDFKLINKTGYTIESVYIAPTGSDTWGEDVMDTEVLKNNTSVDIVFNPAATAKKWDMMVTWQGYTADSNVEWEGFDLSTINSITLYYDSSTGKTRAEWD